MPAVILGGLALVGGGFDVEGRHAAGILAWLLVAGLLVSPYRNQVRFAKPFALIAALLLAFSALSAFSSVWSSSTAASLTEAERGVAYLGFFSLAFLVCQTSRQRRLFVDGLFVAVALIVVLAIAERCLPGTEIPMSESARLRFPLGYWNANGLICGIAVVFFAWQNRAGSFTLLRWLAAALIPVALITLYLTYSRGGLAAGLVTFACLFLLSPHRLRLLGVIGTGTIVALPVLLVVENNPTIAENLGGPDAPAEGRAVAVALIASMVVSVLLVRALLAFFARKPGLSRRALKVSRDSRFVKGVAASGAIALVLLAVVFGGQIWSQFSSDEISFPYEDPKAQFTRLSGTGRDQFIKVAAESFANNPLTGTGAGTYRYAWAQERDTDLVAQDAHSLYFESFAELGIAGGLLVLAMIISMVLIAAQAWRLSPTEQRERSAMLLAILLGVVFSLGIDWTWELAATAGLLMFVSACSAAALQGFRREDRVLRTPDRRPGAGQVGGALLVSWLAIVVLSVPFAADQYMKSSGAAAADGRIEDSIASSRSASRLEPWSPAPHLQLATIAQSLGFYERSIAEYSRAAELEPENWQPPFLRSVAEFERGRLNAAARDLDIAFELNPRSRQLADWRIVLDAAADER
jgi:O-antigen ligase